MSSRGNGQLWMACSAAFACGAAAGAYAMHLYFKSTEQQPEQRVQTIDLSQLTGLPVPSGDGMSETASVSSYSLPATPRMSRSGSVNTGNGISRQMSRSSSSGGDAG